MKKFTETGLPDNEIVKKAYNMFITERYKDPKAYEEIDAIINLAKYGEDISPDFLAATFLIDPKTIGNETIYQNFPETVLIEIDELRDALINSQRDVSIRPNNVKQYLASSYIIVLEAIKSEINRHNENGSKNELMTSPKETLLHLKTIEAEIDKLAPASMIEKNKKLITDIKTLVINSSKKLNMNPSVPKPPPAF